MKTTLTKSDIPRYAPETLAIGDGFTLRVDAESDYEQSAPWKEHDGHGPVSEWVRRDKAPGERLLWEERGAKLYYDFAAAVALARKDGWDCEPYHAAFPGETAGQKAARAAEHDFEYCRKFASGQWEWLCLTVKLFENDNEVASDSLGGVEGFGDYWREQLAEMANSLIASHVSELAERAEWEARDTVTR